MNDRKQAVLTGLVCIVLGLSVCLIGIGVIPYDPDKIHAPVWVIVTGGGVFVLGGLAVVFQRKTLLVSVLGNLLVIAFAAVAAWVAVSGPAAQFSGGIPFLSHEWNVTIARYVFGIGSLLCLLMLIPGISHLRKLLSARRDR